MNIVAGNGYFGKKKKLYADSTIAITKEMATSPIQEWSLDDITERDVHVSECLLKTLAKWSKEYSQQGTTTPEPTPEQLEMIRKFRENGWV